MRVNLFDGSLYYIFLCFSSLLYLIGCSEVNSETPAKLQVDTHKKPGMATMVISKGKSQVVQLSGFANIEKQTKIDQETNFRLASVSKQFTAMAAAILMEQRLLDYEDPLSKFIPEFSEFESQVKVKDLIHHTSGLPDYLSEICAGEKKKNNDVLQFVLRRKELTFDPGSRYEYSNTGYVVLANVVAIASQKSFPAFVKEAIFEPIGMHRSLVFDSQITHIYKRALGYEFVAGQYKLSDEDPCSPIHGDGGVYSSLNDLARWASALEHGDLVSPARMKQIFSPITSTLGKPIPYGFGWRIDRFMQLPRYFHGGSWLGYRTRIAYLPEQSLWAIVLSNLNHTKVNEIADALLKDNL